MNIWEKLHPSDYDDYLKLRGWYKPQVYNPVDERYADPDPNSVTIRHKGYATVPPFGIVDVFEATDNLTHITCDAVILCVDALKSYGEDFLTDIEDLCKDAPIRQEAPSQEA